MTTIKLNDLQLVLLCAAAQREDGSLLPPPATITQQAARIRKVIPPLLTKALVEEKPTSEADKVWREEGDERFALIITDAGRAAIGVGEKSDAPESSAESGAALSASEPKRTTKTDLVLSLLHREEGVTLDELVAATSWLPHSARAALTGLRKKGHTITLDKSSERHCYRVAEGATV
jgi:hypothetical protein